MSNNESYQEDSTFVHLPKESWFGVWDLYQWQGFWWTHRMLKSAMAMRAHFQPLPGDIILASSPKTGTTWLKALLFSIINHNSSSRKLDDDPLLTCNPHQLVPFLDLDFYDKDPTPELTGIPSPRLFATHLPYELLPESIKNSGCRIIYITRNPRDTFVSFWHFVNTAVPRPYPLEEAFESFCKGISPVGPFFDHVLGYWKEKEKVLFITYEEIKKDPQSHVKKLAEFLECQLNKEEEIEEIVWRCSHERLSNLEVNKNLRVGHWNGFRYNSFFRRGVVGDWRNYFTTEMIERLDMIMRQKLDGSGLFFLGLTDSNGGEA